MMWCFVWRIQFCRNRVDQLGFSIVAVLRAGCWRSACGVGTAAPFAQVDAFLLTGFGEAPTANDTRMQDGVRGV